MKLRYTILNLLLSAQQLYGNKLIRHFWKKFRRTKSAGKFIMRIFLHHKSVIYQHVLSSKNTVNGEYHVSVSKKMWEHIDKAPWNGKDCITLMLAYMSVLLFSNTLVNIDLRWYDILLAVQIFAYRLKEWILKNNEVYFVVNILLDFFFIILLLNFMECLYTFNYLTFTIFIIIY